MWSPLGEGSHARHQSQLKPFTLHIGHRVPSPLAREGQGEGACGRVGGTAGAKVITGYPDLPPLPDGQAILQLVSQRDVIASDVRGFFSASSVLAPYQVSR